MLIKVVHANCDPWCNFLFPIVGDLIHVGVSHNVKALLQNVVVLKTCLRHGFLGVKIHALLDHQY